MEAFVKDYDKVIKKQRMLETNDPLDRLINIVNEAKDKIRAGTLRHGKDGLLTCFILESEKRHFMLRWDCVWPIPNCFVIFPCGIDPSSVSASLTALGKTIKTVSSGISEEHKELQSALSKYSKAIDKVWCERDTCARRPPWNRRRGWEGSEKQSHCSSIVVSCSMPSTTTIFSLLLPIEIHWRYDRSHQPTRVRQQGKYPAQHNSYALYSPRKLWDWRHVCKGTKQNIEIEARVRLLWLSVLTDAMLTSISMLATHTFRKQDWNCPNRWGTSSWKCLRLSRHWK